MGMPPVDGASRWAIERVLRLTALVWGAAWIASLVTAAIAEPEAVASTGTTVICLVLVIASWVALAFVRRIPSSQFVVVVSATALVTVANIGIEGLSETAAIITTWLNLAAISAALLLPRRWAPPWTVIVSTTAFAILTARLMAADAPQPAWDVALAAFAFAVAVGMAVWVAANELRRVADIADLRAREPAPRRAIEPIDTLTETRWSS